MQMEIWAAPCVLVRIRVNFGCWYEGFRYYQIILEIMNGIDIGYEVNINFKKQLEEAGLVFLAFHPTANFQK